MLTTRRVEKRFATFLLPLCVSIALLQGGVFGQTLQDNLYITTGVVNSMVTSGNTIYIGGQFNYVGPATGYGAGVSTTTGQPDLAFPPINGTVNTVIPDGSGGWYVGGLFTRVGTVTRNNIAHIMPDKTLDMTWNPNASNQVLAIAVSGSTVYLGGSFTTIGGVSRICIAAVDATTGTPTSWNPSANTSVYALVVSGSTVYAVGSFTTIGGQTRNRIAALDASTGLATSWNPNANGTLYCMVLSGSTMYVGGASGFTSIGGQTRNRIAAVDVTTGLATTWNPNANGFFGGSVFALAISGSTVYAGGSFDNIGGAARNFFAALDITSGNATSWNPNPGPGTGYVHSIAISGSTVYAAGSFNSIGGQTRNYVAALDATTGLATSWNPNASAQANVIALSGSTAFVGGAFQSIGGQERKNIAALDATTGLVTSWNANITGNSNVLALAVSGSTVYFGGAFGTVGGQTRNNIAAVDATTGAVTSWNPNANSGGFAVEVDDIAVSGSTVYAGGLFTSIGGQARSNLGALDATTGLAMSWNPNANSEVFSVAVSGSTVYAGGDFTSIGGQSRNRIAALDATTGLATGWNPNSNGRVYALVVSGSTVYAGGTYTSIAGSTSKYIAAIDAATGTAPNWNSSGDPGQEVRSIALAGSNVYVGGSFASGTMGGQSRKRLAALNATTGLATSWNPNADGSVNAQVNCVSIIGSTIYAGGDFTTMLNNNYRPSLAGLSDQELMPMSYTSSTVTQNTTNISPNTTNQQIIGIQVLTSGGASPINITSLNVNTNGTTSAADISNLKIFSTGTSSTFATTTQFGATVASPSGPVTVNGSQTLSSGTNYFWLTYDIPAGATSGNAVDAECNSITGSGSMGTQTPSPQAPAGSRPIIGPLSGDYTVGVALFNRLTGRNIVSERRTRRVMREAPILDEPSRSRSSEVKVGNEMTQESSSKPIRSTTEEVEVDEGLLMENGKPYRGDLFIPLTAEDISKLGLTSSPQGIYLTITAALVDLNGRGVGGAVRFLLTDASYSETYPLVINPFTGASATNTVTLKPNTGVGATISGSSASSIIKFSGVDYFIIDGSNTNGGTTRNLTINNTSTASNTAAIWVSSLGAGAGATNNTIKNCNVAAGIFAVTSTFGIHVGGTSISPGGSGADNDNLTIQNNSITKAHYGIFAYAFLANDNDFMVISQNSIGASTGGVNQIGYAGIFVGYLNNGSIDQNTVFNIVGTVVLRPVGIRLSNVTATAIRRNDVHSIRYTGFSGNGGRGIEVASGGTNMVLTDNIIYDILGDGWSDFDNGIFGIGLNGTGFQVYYNSVNLSGSISRSSASSDVSAALYIYPGVSGADIRDNIFANSIVNTTGVAKAYSIYSAVSSSGFTDINYNNYYASGAEGVLGFLSSVQTTLADWQAATTKDAQSVSANPGFTSSTNLHVDPANANSWNVNGRGVAIASVATDIDGDARSITPGTPTDIGADEFATPSVDPPAATMSGTIANGGTTTFTSAGRQVGQITWHGTGAPSSPTSLPTSVTFKYYPGKLPPPFVTGQPNFINSYWEITTPDGSGFTYDLTLNYTVAEINAIPELDLGVAKRDGSNPWVHQSGAVVNNTAKTVFIGGLTSFSQFTLDDNNAPLPIQLASFTATEIPNRGVLLRWSTLSEVNNYGFYAQRKRQSETAWTEIPNSFIAGHGTTNEPHNYAFSDSSVSRGSWSYRLKQVDLDGTVHYSDAIQVSVVTDVRETAPIEFSLKQNYPNPFNPSTEIKFSVGTTDRATLDVYNMLGQKVATLFDALAEAGQYYKVRFDAGRIASGVYFYRLQSGKRNDLKKLLLLK